jgi:hypothetical protein
MNYYERHVQNQIVDTRASAVIIVAALVLAALLLS